MGSRSGPIGIPPETDIKMRYHTRRRRIDSYRAALVVRGSRGITLAVAGSKPEERVYVKCGARPAARESHSGNSDVLASSNVRLTARAA